MALPLGDQFYTARKISAPIVVVRTPDPAATIADLSAHADVPVNGQKRPAALLAWDTQRGVVALNKLGSDAVRDTFGPGAKDLLNLSDALAIAAPKLPAHAVLFVHMAHRFWRDTATVQAVWNLRDTFKTNFRTLVLLTMQGQPVPAEIASDAIVFTEAYPDPVRLDAMITALLDGAELPNAADVRKRAVDAVAGLAMFPAEQAVSMSLGKAGIDVDTLWERKRQTVEETPGLTVRRDGFKLDTVIGYENAKTYLRKIAPRYNVILFIDEIDKGLGGWNTDTSGVSQDFHQVLLTKMDAPNVSGVMFVGHRGTGKTALATAIGNEAGIPTVTFDMGGMKAKHVGDSEGNIRNAWAVTEAIGQGRVLVIATCNRAANLSPEIMRRFGTPFFFELPARGELDGMWDLYTRRPHPEAEGPLSKAQIATRPDSTGWTGSDVKRCCEVAWRLDVPLVEAAQFVVPVALSRPADVERLRQEADGAYISASIPGTYHHTEIDARTIPAPVKRALSTMKES